MGELTPAIRGAASLATKAIRSDEFRSGLWRDRLNKAADNRARQLGIKRNPVDENRAFWQKVLDLLQTGNFATAGFAMSIKRGDPKVWGGIIRGIKDRTTFADVLAEGGVTGKAGFALGLAGDIFLDPFTYIPIVGQTTKGAQIAKIAGKVRQLEKARETLTAAGGAGARVLTSKARKEAVSLALARRLGPRSEKIVRKALADGEDIHLARTFADRIRMNQQRFGVIEIPVGFHKLPIGKTRLKVPIIPKFKPIGQIPLPVAPQVAIGRIMAATATILREKTPVIRDIIDVVGRKVFNQWMRPMFFNPVIWEDYIAAVRRFRSKMSGRTTELLDALEEVSKGPQGNIENAVSEVLSSVGLDKDAIIGSPIHDILSAMMRKRLTKHERRVLINAIDKPWAMLVGKDADLAEVLMRDILGGMPNDPFGLATKMGDPVSVAKLVKDSNRSQLEAAEEAMMRGIDVHENAILAYQRGRIVDEDYYKAITDIENLNEGLRLVKDRASELKKLAGEAIPPKSAVPPQRKVLPRRPPKQGPRVEDDVVTSSFGSAPKAKEERDVLVKRFKGHEKTMDRIAKSMSDAEKTPGGKVADVDEAILAWEDGLKKMDRLASRIRAIDEDLLASQRRMDVLRASDKDSIDQVKRDVKSLRGRKTMTAPAAEILDDAKREISDLEANFKAAKGLGNRERMADLQDQIEQLRGESLGNRFSRLVEDGNLTLREQRIKLQEYHQKGAEFNLRQIEEDVLAAQEAAKTGARVPEGQVTPPIGPVSDAELVARSMGVELETVNVLARDLSPSEFESVVLRELATMSPTQAGRRGESVLESVEAMDLTAVHRQLRKDQGLLPSDLRLNFRDLGRDLDETLVEINEQAAKVIQRVKNLDPRKTVDVSQPHIIGDAARGELVPGDTVDAMVFIRGDMDQVDLDDAFEQTFRLASRPGAVDSEYRVIPWKLAKGQTEEEVLRAHGVPRSSPPEQEVMFPGMENTGIPPVRSTTPPDVGVAADLAKLQPDADDTIPTVNDMILGLQQSEEILEEAVQTSKVFRTNINTKQLRYEKYQARLKSQMAAARAESDIWKEQFWDSAGNLEKAEWERQRHLLNKYDPTPARLENPDTPLEAAKKSAGKPRGRKAPRTAPVTPITRDGVPTINTKGWSPGAKKLLDIDRDNVAEVLENALVTTDAEPQLIFGKWREYDANGKVTGNTQTTEEIIAATRKMDRGEARTVRVVDDEIKLEDTLAHAEFYPDQGVIEIVDSSGKRYQANVKIPFDEASQPRNVSLARNKIKIGEEEFEGIQEAGNILRARIIPENLIEARRIAQDQADISAAVKGIDDFLAKQETFFVTKAGGLKSVIIRAADIGLGNGPLRGHPRVVGSFAPRQYSPGELVVINGQVGRVLMTRAKDLRTVQMVDGTVVDMHIDDLALATYRELAQNGESISDFIVRSSQRVDGSVDIDELNRLTDQAAKDPKVRRELVTDLVDSLIRDISPALLVKRQQLINILESFAVSEKSRELLNGYIYFYAPRLANRDSKWKFFGGRGQINMSKEWFQQERKTLMHLLDDINEQARALGRDAPFEEDAILAIAARGVGSIRVTETYDFITEILAKFGTRVADIIGTEGDHLARTDIAVAAMMKKLGYPEEQIKEGLESIAELIQLEGTSFGEALKKGEQMRRMPPEQAEKIRKRIKKLRVKVQELVPDFGFYVPRGQIAKLRIDLEDVTIADQILDGTQTREKFQGIIDLLENSAKSEGDQMIFVPYDKLQAITALSPHIDAYVMPIEVVKHLNGHLSSFMDLGSDLRPFIRVFDVVQNWWKAWTLGIFPTYHLRNAVGNIWNSFLAGANVPETYVQAGRLEAGTLTDFVDDFGDHIPQERLKKWIVEGGLRGRGEFASEIRSVADARLAGVEQPTSLTGVLRNLPLDIGPIIAGLRGKRTTANIWLTVGLEVGRRVEDHAKVALFLDGIRKGMDPEVAARRVKKYLFDYEDVSDVERNVFARIFPFYRWSRFNIPLQAETFITRPAKFTGVDKGIQNIRKFVGEPPDEELMPEWMKDQVAIPVKRLAKDQWAYFTLGNWLPAADLVRAFDPAAMAGGMLTPLVKAPIEWATNYSLFFKTNIERFPRETSEFFGVNLRRRTINLARNIRLANQIDKFAFKRDLPLEDRLAQQIVGKLYPVNFTRQRDFAAYRFNRNAGALVASIKRESRKLDKAKKEGKSAQAAAIRGNLRFLIDELATVKLDQKRLKLQLPKKSAKEKRLRKKETAKIQRQIRKLAKDAGLEPSIF